VLIIGQYFPPDLGGAATRAYNAAKGLLLNGCKVTVVTAFPHYPDGEISEEYRWKPFKVEWFRRIRVIRTFIFPLESKGLARRIILFVSFVMSSLFGLLLVGEVDVIWAANPDIISMVPALVYGKVKRKPVLSNVDDLILQDLYDLEMMREGSVISKVAELVARMVYGEAEGITPVSPGYVGYVCERYGVEKSKVHVVRGGVDLAIFKQDFSECNGDCKFSVVYSGAFSVAYDFEQVLKAAKIVEEKDGEVEFVLQGKGELADQIKSTIKELNLNNVTVIDRVFSREKVAELINQADVLILPLRDLGKPYLGISSKLYEYQAAGKPIICCSSGEPGRYVSETESGVVVEPGDYEGLAKAVLYLRENQGVAEKLGASGRRYVENSLSIERIGLKMKSIFKSVMM